MMVFMPLFAVWIGPYCRDVIGRQNVKVAVIGRMWFCGNFGDPSIVCKVQIAVGVQ